jgi:hypothetical protein
MSKKSLIVLIVAAFVMSLGVAVSFAVDKGPAEITLNADGTKPAMFPHAKHQEKNECGTCHHYLKDNVPTPCDDGTPQEDFKKCDSCHNADMENEKLRTWKDIGHALCKDCHTKMKDAGAPTKCNDCHVKKEG